MVHANIIEISFLDVFNKKKIKKWDDVHKN